MSVTIAMRHSVTLGIDPVGSITRIENAIERIPDKLKKSRERLTNTKEQLRIAKKEAEKPFAQEDELTEKSKRLSELDSLLNISEKDSVMLEDGLGEAGLPKKDKAHEQGR